MKMIESGRTVRTATRLIDGVIPRVDFVDAGANGEGENGFLVKKNRKGSDTMPGMLQYDEKGEKWVIVQKSDDTAEATPIKMSADSKAALTTVLTASKAKLEALEKALGDSEDDAEATDLPEAIQTMVADLVGQFVSSEKAKPPKGKIPPQFLPGGKKPPMDEEEDAKAKAKAKADAAKVKDAKKSDDDAAAAPIDSFTIGDLTVAGPLADIAKAMAESAGDKMNDPEFAGLFRDGLAPMAQLQAALDPSIATNVAMASVEKRMKTEIDALKATIAAQNATSETLQTRIDALGAGFGGLPQMVLDGASSSDAVAPVKKAAMTLMAGQDISEAGISFVD